MVTSYNPRQYDILLIDLDPTKGSEIFKIRPCVVLSPDEMNSNIQTILIAPMTTKHNHYPSRVPITFQEKDGWIVLDQIRAVDKVRIVKHLGILEEKTTLQVKETLKEMLID